VSGVGVDLQVGRDAPRICEVITDPDATRVLCFGDSNTYGCPGDDIDYVRLGADRRWTGLLQRLLGDGYDVIEEGLNGRTTDVEYEDRPGHNGRPYFVPCLLSHQPLDVVVIMLGSNDLKACFGRTPRDIAEALHGYIDDVADNVAEGGRVPVTVLVSPVRMDDTAAWFEEISGADFDREIVSRSRQLTEEIRRVAQERGVLHADAAQVARVGADGLHFTLDSHPRFAELIAATVSRALPDSLAR